MAQSTDEVPYTATLALPRTRTMAPAPLVLVDQSETPLLLRTTKLPSCVMDAVLPVLVVNVAHWRTPVAELSTRLPSVRILRDQARLADMICSPDRSTWPGSSRS